MKGRLDMVVDCIWLVCNISFECGAFPEDWRSAVMGSRLNARIIEVFAP